MKTTPVWRHGNRKKTVRLADLFSGCGGMTVGVAIAASEARPGISLIPVLALDVDPVAAAVHAANFPDSEHLVGAIETFLDGELGVPLTATEKLFRRKHGNIDLLVGGPPCQGNSNLNNHSRRNDTRNALYSKMARAAQVLGARAVIIENVPAVIHDKHGVVEETTNDLRRQGYAVHGTVIPMTRAGVPQLRKRHVLLAAKGGLFDPEAVLHSISRNDSFAKPRPIRWAIRDLRTKPERTRTAFDTPSTPSSENAQRMQWLIENDAHELPNALRPPCHQHGDHSYYSVYGRMQWDQPAQTITTGFGSTGQGCYVHPQYPRTITPHEAARIQTFPDFFDFSAAETRTALARMIGNAVPPFFMRALVREILPAL